LNPVINQFLFILNLILWNYCSQSCWNHEQHLRAISSQMFKFKKDLFSVISDLPEMFIFCANDPEVFLQAALLAQDYCDAIDLNLGCPQMIAKRGHYGVFLQDEWELLEKMVRLANEKLSVPITCKIRVFKEVEKTVRYAQMLEKAGCQLLTVHGRTKDQKGAMTGIASWEHIKAVRKAVNIPVFANGNIQHLSDVERCIQETGVQGVMSAEGNLHNPALFEGCSPPVWEMAEEYLEVVKQYPPCTLSYVRAHLFKLWHHTLQIHQDLREELAKVKTLEGLADVSKQLRLRCQEEIAKGKDVEEKKSDLPFPHWICQPYVRPPLTHDVLSFYLQGNKCVFNLCRGCCKKKAYKEVADCPSHGLRFKTKAERRKAEEDEQKNDEQKEESVTERSSSSPQLLPDSCTDLQEQSKPHLLL
uniref:Dihydrouridine synthase 1-like (S. cerevisiae) n=1 Tax=Acanthochromis polyacanthus TaxID=80966 RepID=A0A3Q1G342_9TELE